MNRCRFAKSIAPWMVLQGDADRVCDAGATRRFVDQTGAARLFSLPLVGHGFGVPAPWTPPFLQAYRAVSEARPPWSETPHAATGHHFSGEYGRIVSAILR